MIKHSEYLEHAISVDEDGKFVAEIGGKERRRASLAALRTLIEKTQSGVTVMVVYKEKPQMPTLREAVALRGDQFRSKIMTPAGGTEDLGWRYIVLPESPKLMQELSDIYSRYQEIFGEWRAAISRSSFPDGMNAENFNGYRKALLEAANDS